MTIGKQKLTGLFLKRSMRRTMPATAEGLPLSQLMWLHFLSEVTISETKRAADGRTERSHESR
jgi:hypothetical protein